MFSESGRCAFEQQAGIIDRGVKVCAAVKSHTACLVRIFLVLADDARASQIFATRVSEWVVGMD